MKATNNSCCESHIYPGEFIPSISKEDLDKNSNKIKVKKTPLLNFTELPELLKIEIALPGIEKEDILVESEQNILSVKAIHKKSDKSLEGVLTIHEFDYEIFERKIPLPKNADVSFIHAEYTHGILKMHIPKTNKNEHIQASTIVVY
jgi:HSP20 family protein